MCHFISGATLYEPMPKEKKKKRVPDFQKTKLKVGRSRTKDPKQYQSLPKVQTISIAVQPSVRKRLAKNDEDDRDEASPNDRIKVSREAEREEKK